ncbi:glycosyltransferase [Candidatus Dojkabacteria bacterium]|nr:glycosyltransferase [Candidatus Dojkabacteria bacterium]
MQDQFVSRDKIQMPRVCVVVPVKNRLKETLRFLESFSKCSYPNFTIVIVDDKSSDGSPEVIKKERPETIILKGNGNLWWTGATNLGIKYAKRNDYEYILTINNDATVGPDLLTKLVDCSKKNPNSIIGSSIINAENNKIWGIGTTINWGAFKEQIFSLNFHGKPYSKIVKNIPNPYPVETLPGNGVLIPVRVFDKIGLYDSFWFPHYHADSEIGLRAKRVGIRSLICTNAKVYNHDFKKRLFDKDFDLLIKKKSYLYWKPIFAIFMKYAPKEHKNKFVRQYFFLYEDKKWYLLYKDIVRKIKNLFSK